MSNQKHSRPLHPLARLYDIMIVNYHRIVYEAIDEGGRKKERNREKNETETAKRKTESLRESVFTVVQASPPKRNSFHVSSLPACPYASVYRGRLNHLLMSFPKLSLAITVRNSMVKTRWPLTCRVYIDGCYDCHVHDSNMNEVIRPLKHRSATYFKGDI